MNSGKNNSVKHRTIIRWGVLLLAVFITELLKYFPGFIEEYYAAGIYPSIGKAFRWLLGWVPFSVGDVLIGMLIIYVLLHLFRSIRLAKRNAITFKGTVQKARHFVFTVACIYVLFHVLWGFNYYRKGSAWLLQIKPVEYSTADVDTLLNTLHHKLVNICADSILIESQKSRIRSELQQQAMHAWDLAANQYAFMRFSWPSLKPNLLGPLQSYTGYGGYLFPFTGEAQVDFYVPAYVLPFTVCHEMAHQQGFGSESEANMIGFLAARASSNRAFVYSAYADMHDYALREMYRRDSTLAIVWRNQLPPLLQKDRKELFDYYRSHKNLAQPLLDWVYNNYLLRTNQPEGLQSYNRVVAWLIAYGKKYGWENI